MNVEISSERILAFVSNYYSYLIRSTSLLNDTAGR